MSTTVITFTFRGATISSFFNFSNSTGYGFCSIINIIFNLEWSLYTCWYINSRFYCNFFSFSNRTLKSRST